MPPRTYAVGTPVIDRAGLGIRLVWQWGRIYYFGVKPILLQLFGVSLLVAWVLIFKKRSKKSSGWDAIAARFPAATTLTPDEIYKRQFGIIGNTYYRQAFDVQLTPDGVRVRSSFASQTPIMVPWASIRNVYSGEFILVLTVDYESKLEFHLPSTVSAVVKEHVPAERWQKRVSLVETVKAQMKADPGIHWVGRKPAPQVSATTTCFGCHATIPADASVCPKCGRKLF